MGHDSEGRKPGAAGDPDSTETRDAETPALSSISIPGYRILRKVGEGGMGEVYEAEQLDPVRRRVALKLLKAGMDTKQVLARFEAERQALALMNHAYIAQVYDAGATDRGRSYFAMEFVRGLPITDYCDEHRLSIRERLDLFIRVCKGVRHAHQKGSSIATSSPRTFSSRSRTTRSSPRSSTSDWRVQPTGG